MHLASLRSCASCRGRHAFQAAVLERAPASTLRDSRCPKCLSVGRAHHGPGERGVLEPAAVAHCRATPSRVSRARRTVVTKLSWSAADRRNGSVHDPIRRPSDLGKCERPAALEPHRGCLARVTLASRRPSRAAYTRPRGRRSAWSPIRPAGMPASGSTIFPRDAATLTSPQSSGALASNDNACMEVSGLEPPTSTLRRRSSWSRSHDRVRRRRSGRRDPPAESTRSGKSASFRCQTAAR